MKKMILVFGATGQQGNAVARELLANDFEVRAFVRNGNAAPAIDLKTLGAEIFQGDLQNASEISEALNGVNGIFLVLPPEWNPTAETDNAEWLLGKQIIDKAKENNVEQIVYSSVMASELQAEFRPYFKFQIEEYLAKSGLQYTILKPAAFYENFFMPHYGLPEKLIYNPLPAAMRLPFIAVNDIGVFARLAFQQPAQYNEKILNITGELLTAAEIAELLTEELSVKITAVEVPLEMVKAQNELLGKFMEVLSQKDYPEIDVNEFRQLNPKLLSLKDWIVRYGKEKLQAIVS
jgi:uncharacterized protein YbjT (DUF2867 family)